MRKLFFLLIGIGIFQATNGQIAGLVGYYPFTVNAGDSSGGNFHGALYGSSVVTGGMLSIGDNDEDYMALPPDVLDGSQEFTIVMRVHFNAFHTTGTSPTNSIFVADRFAVEGIFNFAYEKNAEAWRFAMDGGVFDFPDASVQTNTWYCVVLMRDGGNNLRLTVDGVESTSVYNVGQLVDIDTLIVGQETDCFAGCFVQNQSLDGQIDHLSFYNRELTCLEQANGCNSPFTTPPANQTDSLVAYYKFSGNANDASGNGFDGTLGGAATANDSLLTGDNDVDYLTIPAPVFDGLSDFTINFRVKFNTFQTIGNAPANTIFSADISGSGSADPFAFSYEKNIDVWKFAFNGSDYTFTDVALQPNQWYCMTLTRNAAGDLQLYKDGIAFPEIPSVVGAVDVDTVIVGQETDCFGGCFLQNQSLNGMLDEFKVYSRDLDCMNVYDLCDELILDVAVLHHKAAFDLHNHPNPFNETTKFTYTLASSQHVTLKLYDATGREIKTLVNQKQIAGRRTIEFDATELPVGIYTCKLFTGTAFASCKLVLMR